MNRQIIAATLTAFRDSDGHAYVSIPTFLSESEQTRAAWNILNRDRTTFTTVARIRDGFYRAN